MNASLTDGPVNVIPVRTVADVRATLQAAADMGQHLFSWTSELGTQYYFQTDLGFQALVVETRVSDPIEKTSQEALDMVRSRIEEGISLCESIANLAGHSDVNMAEKFGSVSVTDAGRKAGLK